MRLNKLLLAGAVSAALAACGGSSNSSSGNPPPVPPAPVAVVFTGTAAVGAPLVGTVTVKDSAGATKTVQIGTNGAYSVDVTGMTGPFVFRASGSANGQTFTVHSVATSADASGKINITQLTDLVAANVGGQLAQDYFDQFEKNGNAANATVTAINAEVAKLKEKLQPVLTALGVDANADLLRTPFTPLSSPLDTALDTIHVSVDPTTAVATISTTANSTVITDDLKQKAAAEANPPKLVADNVSTALTDAPLVKKALTDFTAKFANGLPEVSALTPLVTTGFLNDDQNAATFLGELTTETSLVGLSFTDVVIHQIDYSDPAKITARVSFTVKTKDGLVLDRLDSWKVRKSPTDGVWRLHGNQRVLALEAFAGMSKIVSANGTCYRTGLNFNIEDFNTGNNVTASAIHHIVITGPGLPPSGLRYNPPSLGGRWNNTVDQASTYFMSSDCAGFVARVGDDALARIPDEASYTVTAYDAADNKLSFAAGTTDGTYTLKVQRRPLTLAETKASTAFPVIADQTVTALAGYSSGTLAFSATNVNPAASAWVRMILDTSVANGAYDVETTVLPNTAGAVSTTLQLPPLQQGETVKARTLWIESPDIYRRNMLTEYHR
jgi:hypothetical protein